MFNGDDEAADVILMMMIIERCMQLHELKVTLKVLFSAAKMCDNLFFKYGVVVSSYLHGSHSIIKLNNKLKP